MSRPGFFVRHRVGLRWTFGVIAGVFLAGTIAAVTMMVVNVMSFIKTDRSFAALPRMAIPGEAVVELPGGDQTIWVERPKNGGRVSEAPIRMNITRQSDGKAIPYEILPESKFVSYSLSGKVGNSIGLVSVPTTGRYRVKVTGDTNHTLVLGNADVATMEHQAKRTGIWAVVATGFAALFFVVLILFILLLVLARKPKGQSQPFESEPPTFGSPTAAPTYPRSTPAPPAPVPTSTAFGNLTPGPQTTT